MATDDGKLGNGEPNRDPITGAPGAHPVGTGLGAAAGALAGAAAGSLGGPVGSVVGLVAGAVAGGLGGKAAAEGVNPTMEDAYWRENYAKETYVDAGRPYDDYGPAYELGWTGRDRRGADFESVEPALATEWESRRGASRLDWSQARPATRAAWDRASETYYAGEFAERESPQEDLSNDDLVDILNDLLENARDGEYGFRACAEEVANANAKQLFASRADGCRQAGIQLIELIRSYGGEPASGGTAAGAMHRGWVHVKGSVGADDELSILESCERGEDTGLGRYRKALKKNLPVDVREVIRKQAEGAQKNHDQIRELRNAARERR
ncbi:PA2169 family four-helix-bundle protein [Variovorax sp. J22R115]|uniref:ferritin-like domain-containing protein n=1 Tax=Variovorax sp. J22R115 TaxID=3053509 RepID=UPI002576EE64|nr:PA2169 family four-helix-bundle protein [Variovorax sp. J22R115]MDM0050412.1 PA2169 family four-helix-bundle protein [Variovorax sp. J22R115]